MYTINWQSYHWTGMAWEERWAVYDKDGQWLATFGVKHHAELFVEALEGIAAKE